MISLLMIADDFTGALDTGVQFSAAGMEVKVVTDTEYDFGQETDATVLVLDAETRHLESREAYRVVYDITRRACETGISYIYKKTDSALRGNIGSELEAVLAASGVKTLPFIPAFPQMNRVTVGGIHYINEVPVAESVFGDDPFEPVRHSYIPDIIRETSGIPTECVPARGRETSEEAGIAVFDMERTEDLISLGRRLLSEGRLHVMAGCAGFAEVLPGLLGLNGRENRRPAVKKSGRMLIACGSVNPITKSQMDYAEAQGFTRIHLNPREKLLPGYWSTEEGTADLYRIRNLCLANTKVILDSNDPAGSCETQEYVEEHTVTMDELRVQITDSIGYLVSSLIHSGVSGTLMVMGGDTLRGFLEQIGVREMRPVCELLPGTVLSEFRSRGETWQIISKSGGFGTETLLSDLAEQVTEWQDTEKGR